MASAVVSITESITPPTTGTTDITAPVTRIGTVMTLVTKQPDKVREISSMGINLIMGSLFCWIILGYKIDLILWGFDFKTSIPIQTPIYKCHLLKKFICINNS